MFRATNYSKSLRQPVLLVVLAVIIVVAGSAIAKAGYASADKVASGQPASASSELIIKEWGVSVRLPYATDIRYELFDGYSAELYLKASVTSNTSCQMLAMGLDRYPNSSQVSVPTTKIGDYQYVLSDGGGFCNADNPQTGRINRIRQAIFTQAFLDTKIEALQ